MKTLLLFTFLFCLVAVFTLGYVAALVLEEGPVSSNIGTEKQFIEKTKDNLNLHLPASGPAEVPSPADRIEEDQIHVYNNRVVLDIRNAEWATFTDTNSMDPVIDYGANAIEIVPRSEAEIEVGDILSYQSKFADGIIIHRVVEIGQDEDGWYARMKGDNNPSMDPGKVRFSQVQRVVVAVIY